MSTEDPRGDWGDWTPGKGVERIRTEMPGVMPDLTEEDYTAADAVIAAASKPAGPALLDVIRRYGAKRVNLEVVPNDRNRAAVVELIGQIEKRIEEDQAAAHARGLSEGRRLRAEQFDALTRGAYEDGRGDGLSEGRRQAAEILHKAAEGRRVYAATPHALSGLLEAEAGLLDRAADAAAGDLKPLYGWLPSWQWTDEMNTALDDREPVEQPEPARGVGWRLARDEEIQDAAHFAAMEERHQHEAEQPEGSDRAE